ncbi:MAG: BamA/TamA family outer membrane protein [Candidatus Zixiibacteriota bacterium]
MLKKLVWILLAVILSFSISVGQTKYFGKNKVQYQDFDWQYLQTRHFDIYFADQKYETAEFAAAVIESSYVVVSEQLDYKIHKRIPIFIYNSPNEFQQTNIISQFLGEGIGGFTEVFKNRIAIPFNGSLEDFRHVLHHELTHAVTYDLLYGNIFASLLSRQRLFNMPLWLAEGYAEYSSRFGWDYYSDMVVRDATINSYLTPLEYLGGYLAYKEGQAVINYIADKYGHEKVGTIFSKGKIYLSINKALKATIGITEKELWEDFSKEMKRRYWPEIARRLEVEEAAKNLTDHTKDPSFFNSKPIFSPKGDRLAIFSDRTDYIEIYIISAIDGKVIERLVKAERTGDLESLHSYLSGITFSPDGDKLAFVVKKSGKDAIYFYDIASKDIYKRSYFDFNSILSPVWSPDGTKLAFSALSNGTRNVMIYDMENEKTYNVCNDDYDDIDPTWFPDSKSIAFSSDRPHPDNDFVLNNPDYEPIDSVDYRTIYNDFPYGNYSLFKIDITNNNIEPIHCGPGINKEPSVSYDGKQICFVSNRNGIDNLYITELDNAKTFAVTDILTGAYTPSWSPEGDRIAFSAFTKGGFDIFLLKDWKPQGKDGVLEPTDYVKGKYEIFQDSLETLPEVTDSLMADENSDSMAIAYGPPMEVDSAQIAEMPDTLTAAPEPTEDDKTDTTRIEDGDYVFVSDEAEIEDDPLSGIFREMPEDSAKISRQPPPEIAAQFDSIAAQNRFPSGDYKVYKYKTKFTPDYVSGGFSYDTFFGLQGQSIFVFSDYLGDHQIVLATDLVNTLDQTNLQLYYWYNKKRINMAAGLFHTKNYYLDADDELFSDRYYGFQSQISYPFSQFSRVELGFSQYFIDRVYHDNNPTTPIDKSSQITSGMLSFVQDNIIWGITGPLNGRRSRLDLEATADLFDTRNSTDVSFYSIEADYRKYWHIRGLFSFAFRFSGGYSGGKTPKTYYLGGTENKIGSISASNDIYEIENLYFSDIITPLRGYDYFELQGDRYFLTNLEFRYPFVEYLKMNFPLPMTIGYITGNWFFDAGATWDDSTKFRLGTSEDGGRLLDLKTSFGFGIRANLGIFVLRYDLAWKTDFNDVAAHPKNYFSIGADF